MDTSTPNIHEKIEQGVDPQWHRAQEGEAEFWKDVADRGWAGVDCAEFINHRQKESMLRALLFLDKSPEFWRDKTVVEFGSGPAGIIEYLNAGRRIAVEPLYEQYKASFPHLQTSTVQYHGCPAEGPLPIEDGVADLVISHNMLDHVFDPERVMAEISRVCRPGGWFLFQVNVYGSQDEIAHKSGHHAELHTCSFTVESALELLNRHGFALHRQILSDSITELGEYYLICSCRKRRDGTPDEIMFQEDEPQNVLRAAQAFPDRDRARHWTALMRAEILYWRELAIFGVNGQSAQDFLATCQRASMEQAVLFVGKPLSWWSDKTIVEIGCGPAGAVEYVPAAQRIGIDPLIEEYREFFPHLKGSPVDYRACAAEEPSSIATASADLVVCFNMLHVSLDPRRVLVDAARMLRQGGYMLVQANVFEDPERAAEIWLPYARPHILTRQLLDDLLARLGFLIEDVRIDPVAPGESYILYSCRMCWAGSSVLRAARAFPDGDQARHWSKLMHADLLYWRNLANFGINGQSAQDFLATGQRNSMEQAVLYVGKRLSWWADKTIVELGCGPAGAVEYVPAAQRIGIDPMIHEYREIFPHLIGSPVDYRACVAEASSVPAASADLVVCYNMIHVSMDPGRVLAEAAQMLRQDGYLLVQANVFEDPEAAAANWPPDAQPHLLTLPLLDELLARQGFVVGRRLVAPLSPGEFFHMSVCRMGK